jgi:hypothetical protein
LEADADVQDNLKRDKTEEENQEDKIKVEVKNAKHAKHAEEEDRY